MQKVIRQVFYFLVLSSFLFSCGSFSGQYEEATKGKALYQISKSEGKNFVRFGKPVFSLPDSAYPLFLVAYDATPSAINFEKQTFQAYEISKQVIGYQIDLHELPKEGKLLLLNKDGGIIDEVYYLDFPTQALLIRKEEKGAFCQREPWLASKDCQEVTRAVTKNRLRTIRSKKDFDSLATLSGKVGFQSYAVKFVIDLQRQKSPHFFSKHWDLHYTFVREEIEKKKKLDRCKKEENDEFNQGWGQYSYNNYTLIHERRYLSGTLFFYPGTKTYTVEFASGDTIIGKQIKVAHETLKKFVPSSFSLKFRPTNERHAQEIQGLKEPPAWIPQNSIYQGEKLQLLSPGEAYGTLKILSSKELKSTTLGLKTIVLLKDVPNNINFVGGIISTNFQSSLSHINVLSRNRGTPHLVLKDGLDRKEVKDMNGKLIHLVVTEKDYTLKLASQEAATKFWAEKEGSRPVFEPKLNKEKKELVDLEKSSLDDLDVIGAKAANMAELSKVLLSSAHHHSCQALFTNEARLRLPDKPFAIPFFWYLQHIKEAKVDTTLQQLHKDPKFRTDGQYRQEKLKEIRDKIRETPVNKELLQKVENAIIERYGKERKVRFRSSTNVEDLDNFSGAGLYTSKSGKVDDADKPIHEAIQKVWASLWADRAWSERQHYNINHLKAAMAILVHPSFPDEKANGVAISTNIFHPEGSFSSFIAVQKGEVSVVNPEDDSTPDQFLIRWWETPEIHFISRSSLTKGQPVLSREESLKLGCSLRAIHNYFAKHYHKDGKPYAMDIEFKFDTTEDFMEKRILFIKQARPYIFGEKQTTGSTCREK